jgi:alpha-tubulin suppressor-like RCC1 family protein
VRRRPVEKDPLERPLRQLPAGTRHAAIAALAAGLIAASPAPALAAVFGFGANKHGELGIGARYPTQLVPVAAQEAGPVMRVVSSYYQSFFLLSNGTVEGVGGDQLGELGIGVMLQQAVTRPIPIPALTGVTQITGQFVLKAGVPWAWGGNEYGSLGNGTSGKGQRSMVPQPVPGLRGIVYIASGGASRFAVNAADEVLAWGENSTGQLGFHARGEYSRPTPTKVPIMGVVQIACGSVTSLGGHTLFLLADGTILARGDDRHGESGSPGLRGVVEVSAGIQHSLARTADGSVWQWGWSVGPVPQRVSLPGPATAISDGWHYSLALVRGKVYGWGSDLYGQLGVGSKRTSSRPKAARGLARVTAIAAGEYHSLVIAAPRTSGRPTQPRRARPPRRPRGSLGTSRPRHHARRTHVRVRRRHRGRSTPAA